MLRLMPDLGQSRFLAPDACGRIAGWAGYQSAAYFHLFGGADTLVEGRRCITAQLTGGTAALPWGVRALLQSWPSMSWLVTLLAAGRVRRP